MKVYSIQTHKIVPDDQNIFRIIKRYITRLRENSIVVITSKIVSICEGRVIKVGDVDKRKLIIEEADSYLPPEKNKYNIILTIKNNLLVPTAGIDESNGNGYFILWPSEPQKTANKIRSYIKKTFSLKQVGVVITDSKTTPLRWGTTGVALAHSGFSALNNYIGKPDIFGRDLHVTKANMMDALAVSAVLIMGEGNEQTPLAIIEDIPFVKFQNRNPSKSELSELHISIDDDLYAPLLKGAKWQKSNQRNKIVSRKIAP